MIDCVPESNLGFQAIKKNGWKPGIGLNILEGGSLSTIKTAAKDAKPELDFSKGKDENMFHTQLICRTPSQSPPPPPPSPQAVSLKTSF